METVSCPICEQPNGIFWGEEFNHFTIVKCPTCRLRYVSPRKPDADIRHMYQEQYFADHHNRLDIHNVEYIVQQESQSLKRILAYAQTGTIEALTLLDIGAGNGSFLITAKMAGLHHLAATDITASRAHLLKAFNINLYVGDILELALGQYDIITAHHVLEHVTDPNAFLARIHSLLNDQGVVHFIIPNEGSLTSIVKSILSKYKIKKEAYKHLSPSHHLYFYEGFSIRNLLQKHNFEILYVGTRCKPKKRSLIAAAAHDLLDTLNLNTWLEVVVKKSD